MTKNSFPLNKEDWDIDEKKSDVPSLSIQVGGKHYKQYAIQPVEYIVKNNIPFIEGNIIKYVTRHKSKNGIEDIRKAYHYLKMIAEIEYGEDLDG